MFQKAFVVRSPLVKTLGSGAPPLAEGVSRTKFVIPCREGTFPVAMEVQITGDQVG